MGMKPRDLSTVAGSRYRIVIARYDRTTRQFKPVKGFASSFNLSGDGNLEKCWTRINQAIKAFLAVIGQSTQGEEEADAAGDSVSDSPSAHR